MSAFARLKTSGFKACARNKHCARAVLFAPLTLKLTIQFTVIDVMSPFAKLLLVYDGSAESQAALERCAQLSLALSAQVDVVSVVDAESANAHCGGLLSDLAFHRLEELARSTLDHAVSQLTGDGIVASGYVSFGRLNDVVLRHTQAFNPDLVVVGHRPQARRSRWWRSRAAHHELTERLCGTTIVTVTLPGT
jgi:nucleotide-binding universal stress UspA family protein